jgi:hypothetical protein
VVEVLAAGDGVERGGAETPRIGVVRLPAAEQERERKRQDDESGHSETEDPAQLREALLEAQMQLELGEITEEQFVELEATLMVRLRAIRQRELDAAEGMEVSGVEISVDRALDGAD